MPDKLCFKDVPVGALWAHYPDRGPTYLKFREADSRDPRLLTSVKIKPSKDGYEALQSSYDTVSTHPSSVCYVFASPGEHDTPYRDYVFSQTPNVLRNVLRNVPDIPVF